MKHSKSMLIPSLVFFSAVAAIAGPVTTVPWNGHTGAVSYTYDDARPTQATVLMPQLDAAGVKATFFIALKNCNGTFETDKTKFINAAKNGHELGNHTMDHVSPSSTKIVNDMATYLRALDPVVEAVTFAYPNCTYTGGSNVGSESFIGRTCGQTSYAWGTQPQDWMNIQGYILTSSPDNSGTAVGLINGVKNSNSWVTMIVHGITTGDQYSITKENNQKLLDAGKNSNLWIDTYQKVAAYYRAHFTMDNAQAQTTSTGWKMTWTSPHSKMPKSVKLRVNLAAATFGSNFTVKQGGVAIPKESDGTYIIDFMKLSLDVEKAGAASSMAPVSSSVMPVSSSLPAVSSWVMPMSSTITWPWLSSSSGSVGIATTGKLLQATITEYKVFDLFGTLQFQGSALPQNLSSGVWIVKALDSQGRLVRSWAQSQN